VRNTANKGDIIVAGIPGEEATVKGYRTERNKIVLVPYNSTMSPMVFDPEDVTIFGRVVSVLRKL
jgi:repressor LexA